MKLQLEQLGMHFRNNSKFWLIATALFLVNFILKMKDVELQPITLDEPFSIFVAQFSLPEIITYLSQGNNPPLYEILLHFWIKLFGISPTAVRFPSVIFSSLTAACVYYLGRKVFNQRVGLFAAAFFTLSNYQMFFAHQARGYAMAILLLCLSIIFFLKLLEKAPSRLETAAYVFSSILLIYSHYFGIFILLVQFIWVISLIQSNKSKAIYFLKIFGVIGLLYLPNVAVVIRQFLFASSSETWLTPVTDWSQFSYLIWVFCNSNNLIFILFLTLMFLLGGIRIMKMKVPKALQYALVLITSFVILYLIYIRIPFELSPSFQDLFWKYGDALGLKIFIGIFLLFLIGLSLKGKWAERDIKSFLLLWFITPLIIMFVASIWIPMFLPQYLFIISPVFALLLAAGLDAVLGKSYPVFLVLFLVSFSLTFRLMIDSTRDIVELTDYVKAHNTESTSVFVTPPYFDLCFTYNYNREWFQQITPGEIELGTRKVLEEHQIYIVHWVKDIDISLIQNAENVLFVDGQSNIKNPDLKLNEVFEQYYNAPDTVLVFPEIYRLSAYSK